MLNNENRKKQFSLNVLDYWVGTALETKGNIDVNLWDKIDVSDLWNYSNFSYLEVLDIQLEYSILD